MSELFTLIKSFARREKVKLDSSNYATKEDMKNEPGVDTSKFAKKIDLASLKSNLDQLDTNKLKNAQTKKIN